jgi:hypothetical protein
LISTRWRRASSIGQELAQRRFHYNGTVDTIDFNLRVELQSLPASTADAQVSNVVPEPSSAVMSLFRQPPCAAPSPDLI